MSLTAVHAFHRTAFVHLSNKENPQRLDKTPKANLFCILSLSDGFHGHFQTSKSIFRYLLSTILRCTPTVEEKALLKSGFVFKEWDAPAGQLLPAVWDTVKGKQSGQINGIRQHRASTGRTGSVLPQSTACIFTGTIILLVFSPLLLVPLYPFRVSGGFLLPSSGNFVIN